MYRYQPVELLAPAGSLAILKDLLDAGADAFYVGGKGLNMRLHRADLNFTGEDLIEARRLCHQRGQKLYVTVNKLLGDQDLDDLGPTLAFLADEVRPDAIIVQDLTVAARVRDLGLPLNLHASVMANVHNEAGARALKDLGVERVVLSREASLADARRIRDAVGLEIEYFVHGDMCIAHGSQCLYSNQLFGQSGNRGACMKPCRWPFSARLGEVEYEAAFPLAVKDMNLHGHIPELLAAGVTSFKIEGRMRDAAYLRGIVTAYADALDRFLADPEGFDPSIGAQGLEEHRKRDFTTAYALGRPGPEILNVRWEGTGKFYSTGKVFSAARAEPVLTDERLAQVRAVLAPLAGRPCPTASGRPDLAVRVDTLGAARGAFDAGVDVVIWSGEPFGPGPALPDAPTLGALDGLRAPGRRLALQLPRMMDEAAYEAWHRTLKDASGRFDELYFGHVGSEVAFGALAPRLVADSPLNILNAETAQFWLDRGAALVSLSLELGLTDLRAVLASGRPAELTVHGRPTGMYMENDAYENAPRGAHRPVTEADPFPSSILRLIDAAGQAHPVLKDAMGRNHLLPTLNLNLLALVSDLAAAGLARLRIESALLTPADLGATVAAYRAALDGRPLPPLPADPAGWTLGPLAWD